MEVFNFKTRMPASAQQVFAWHERPGAFERLSPPWVRLEVAERTGGIENGARVTMHVSYGPVNTTWTVEHKGYIKNEQFCDFQVQGPLASYEQMHRFVAESDHSSFIDDTINYQLPAGMAGEFAGNMVMHVEFERLFHYRHKIVLDDLRFANQYQEAETMKIALTGSTGLIGSALVPLLTTQGHSVLRLVRPQSKDNATTPGEKVIWDPSSGMLDAAALEGCDAVVHLAGDNIGSERWSDEKKRRLRASRLDSTKLLCSRIAQLKTPPKVVICASAIGFYGDRGDQPLTEESERGSGFLADLCCDWEAAAKDAQKCGARLVNLRTGVVLSPKGGALQKMLLPFQMGAGGPIGTGKQYFSWIAMDDIIGAILHCLVTDAVSGPVNAVAPNPVTNGEYTHALGHVLQRPAFIPMPAFGARMAFGEFADECLLVSQKVLPKKLENTGYKFRCPEIEGALRHQLGKELGPVAT
jgi:uncharacterized protein (TIGR01777 family)